MNGYESEGRILFIFGIDSKTLTRILANSATESKIIQEKPCPFPPVMSYIEAAWAFIKWVSDDSTESATADRVTCLNFLRGRGRTNP
jgi:hypothetical protein